MPQTSSTSWLPQLHVLPIISSGYAMKFTPKKTTMSEILAKVKKMRELQKKYFRYRDSLTLAACKKAEREIDELIKQFDEKNKNEPTLFGQ